MKKIIITLVAAFIGVAASAQIYVGGEVFFSHNSDMKSTNFSILPEVGYNLADNMAVGAVVGYDYNGVKDNYSDGTFVLQPYFRYTFLQLGPVNVFADAQLQLGFWSNHNKVTDSKDSGTRLGIGVAPGIAIPVSDNLSFVAHVGSIGYYNDSVICGISGNNCVAGLYYSF